eukprot:Opistho-2@53973
MADDEITWCRVATAEEGRPMARRYHSGVVHDGFLFVFGGAVANKTVSADLFSLQLATGHWQRIMPAGVSPPPRYGHSCVLVENVMYVFGGSNGETTLEDFWKFDFGTTTWNEIPKASSLVWPGPREHHTMVLGDGAFYLFGGARDRKTYYADLYRFSLASRQWERVVADSDGPCPRAGHLSFISEGKLYVYGGYCGDGGFDAIYDTFWLPIYERGSAWTSVETSGVLPRTSRQIASVSHWSGTYAFGGYDGKAPQGHLCRLKMPEMAWETVPVWLVLDNVGAAAVGSVGTFPTPRYGHCMYLNGDELIVFGGSGSMYLNDVIRFNLPERS